MDLDNRFNLDFHSILLAILTSIHLGCLRLISIWQSPRWYLKLIKLLIYLRCFRWASLAFKTVPKLNRDKIKKTEWILYELWIIKKLLWVVRWEKDKKYIWLDLPRSKTHISIIDNPRANNSIHISLSFSRLHTNQRNYIRA